MKEIGVCLCKRMNRKSGIKHNYNSLIGEDEITPKHWKKDKTLVNNIILLILRKMLKVNIISHSLYVGHESLNYGLGVKI